MNKNEWEAVVDSVGKLIGYISRAKENKGEYSRGDISSLRRMDVAEPSFTFWKMVSEAKIEITPQNERRWALVVKGLAIMGGSSSGRPGAVAQEAGYSKSSELRISRLLKSKGEDFETYVEGLIRFLANKGKTFDWFSFARFILSTHDSVRKDFARDFYYTPADKQKAD